MANSFNFKRWRNVLLGVLVSGFFLWIALRDLDWGAVRAVLVNAQWAYIPLVFAVWTLGLASRAVRWRVLLGERVRLAAAFHILNIGFLINNTLPFRVGELARAYLIAHQSMARQGMADDSEVSGWAALSTIAAERILDVFSIVLILALVLPVLPVDPAAITTGLLLGGVALAGFLVLLIFAHRPAWAHALLGLALRFLPFLKRLHLDSLLDRILDGLRPLTTGRGLWGALLWTGISWFFSVAGSWTLALIFPGLPQTPTMRAALALSVSAASFSIIIPFTVASVGPFEAATIFALQTVSGPPESVPPELAATYAVVWHTGAVLHYAIMGVIGLLALGLSLSQVREAASTFSEEVPADSTGNA